MKVRVKKFLKHENIKKKINDERKIIQTTTYCLFKIVIAKKKKVERTNKTVTNE